MPRKSSPNPTLIRQPHDIEAEHAVLACLMLEDGTFDKVLGIITKDDFYDPKNALIFEAISGLHHANDPYDITLVLSALRSPGHLEQAGGADYLIALTHILPNAAHIERYARIVKNKAKLRELMKISSRITEIAHEFDQNVTLDVMGALDESGQLIFDLAKEGSHKDPKLLSVLVGDVYDELSRLYEKGDDMTGIPSGFIDLDRMTNGFQPSNLVVIAGRPAMGKTSFAMNIAQHAAHNGKAVAIFSLEMSSTQIVQRMISAEAEVAGQKLQSGRLEKDDWESLAAAGDSLTGLKIFIDDTSSIPVMEIRSKCRRLSSNKEHGLDLIIIDYLQLMENKRIEQREQQIADISRNLKGLAKELNVPVVALSQLNRSLESRTEKRPLPSDLRESGAIEQDADLILFVYRDEVYHENTPDKGIAEIIIAKHRSGPTGVVKLAFQNEFTKFRNLEKTGLYRN